MITGIKWIDNLGKAKAFKSVNDTPTVSLEYRLIEPPHDEQIIDASLAPATTVITYKLKDVVVGTKTITVSGTTTTIKVT